MPRGLKLISPHQVALQTYADVPLKPDEVRVLLQMVLDAANKTMAIMRAGV